MEERRDNFKKENVANIELLSKKFASHNASVVFLSCLEATLINLLFLFLLPP